MEREDIKTHRVRCNRLETLKMRFFSVLQSHMLHYQSSILKVRERFFSYGEEKGDLNLGDEEFKEFLWRHQQSITKNPLQQLLQIRNSEKEKINKNEKTNEKRSENKLFISLSQFPLQLRFSICCGCSITFFCD